MKTFWIVILLLASSTAHARNETCLPELLEPFKQMPVGEALPGLKELEERMYALEKAQVQDANDIQAVRAGIQHLKEDLLARKDDPAVKAFRQRHINWAISSTLDPIEELLRRLPIKAKLRPLPEVERTHEFPKLTNRKYSLHKVEIAEYIWVDDPQTQEIIDQVHAMGGQVRYVQQMSQDEADSRPTYFSYEAPYFWINSGKTQATKALSSKFIPVIAIDLSQDYALSALKHEFDHFVKWREEYDRIAAENKDLGHREICARLEVIMATPQYIRRTETSARDIEMETERLFPNHPLMRVRGERKPTYYYQYGYVHRMVYPDFEALRPELINSHGNGAEASMLMHEMVRMAITTQAQVNQLPATSIEGAWYGKTVYDLIVKPFNVDRLNSNHLLRNFQQLLLKTCQEMNVANCISPKDLVTAEAN